MSSKNFRYQHIYSSVNGKTPTESQLYTAEIAINAYPHNEHLFIKNSSGDVVSFETAKQTDAKLALKLDASAYTASSAVTSGDTNPVQGGAVYEVITENELVISNALNALDVKKLDASAYTSTSSATEIADALALKLDIDDFDAYSATVYTKDETSGATELSTEFAKYYLKSEASSKTEIDDALTLKLDISDFNTYSGAVNTKFGDYYKKNETSGATEIATALNGKVNTSNVTSAVTSGSTDVLTSGGAYSQLGGLKFIQLTQSEYDNLLVKDNMTVYIIID